MTPKTNGQEAWKTKTEPERDQCDNTNRSGGLATSGGEGNQSGFDQNEAYQPDCKDASGGTGEQRNEADIGKILSQLRQIRATHLAYVKAHENRLRTRLEQNLQHQQTVIAEMDELEKTLVSVLSVRSSEESTEENS